MDEPRARAESQELLRAYRELQLAGSGGCPDAETLAGLVLNDVPPEKREALADHVVSCRRCSEDYQVLSRTHARAAPIRRRLDPRGWIAAAVILFAVAGGVFVARRDRAQTEVTRGAGSSVASLVVPPDGGSLSSAPTEFVWPAQAGAEGYRVKLFGPSGEALWESERVKQNRVGLPPLQRARLSAGQSYFWVVETEMSLEKTRLGPFRFSLS